MCIRVGGDVVLPLFGLRSVRKFALQKQIGNFEVGRVLGELLDRVTAVPQDPLVTFNVGDRAQARRCRREPRIVEPQAGQVLLPLAAIDAAILDGDFKRLTRAIVGDRDGFGHKTSLCEVKKHVEKMMGDS